MTTNLKKAKGKVPFSRVSEIVRPEWTDYNGHFNVGYYVVAFDHATDAFLDWLEIGAEYTAARRQSLFVAEAHVLYLRELRALDPICFSTQYLGHDSKRLHLIHTMQNATEHYVAAINELLLLHVSLAERRVTPWPKDVAERLERTAELYAHLSIPPEAGRSIRLGLS
jgi:acyl-CoA thioester hydrolase